MSAAKKFKYKNLIINLNIDELCELLEKNGVGDCCEVIRSKNIAGEDFLELNEVKISLRMNKLKRPQISRLLKVIELANTNPEKFYEASKTEVKNTKPKIQSPEDDHEIYSNQEIIKNHNVEEDNIYGNQEFIIEEVQYGNQEILLNEPPPSPKPKSYKSLTSSKPFEKIQPQTKPKPSKEEPKISKHWEKNKKKPIVDKLELSNVFSKINQNISKNQSKDIGIRTQSIKHDQNDSKKPLPVEPVESDYLVMDRNFKKPETLYIDSSDDDFDEDPLSGFVLPPPPKVRNCEKPYDVMNPTKKVDQVLKTSKDATDGKKWSYLYKNNEAGHRALPPLPNDDMSTSSPRLTRKINDSPPKEIEEPSYEKVSYDHDDYKHCSWYYQVTREKANEILKDKPNGSFIVRSSTKKEYLCTLMILYCNKVYNLGISKDERGLLMIGSGGIKKQFINVNEIIDYYSDNEFSLMYDGLDVFIKLHNFHE